MPLPASKHFGLRGGAIPRDRTFVEAQMSSTDSIRVDLRGGDSYSWLPVMQRVLASPFLLLSMGRVWPRYAAVAIALGEERTK